PVHAVAVGAAGSIRHAPAARTACLGAQARHRHAVAHRRALADLQAHVLGPAVLRSLTRRTHLVALTRPENEAQPEGKKSHGARGCNRYARRASNESGLIQPKVSSASWRVHAPLTTGVNRACAIDAADMRWVLLMGLLAGCG